MFCLSVDLTAAYDGAACAFNQVSDAICVKRIYHVALVFGSFGFLAVVFLYFEGTLFEEFLNFCLMNEDVVWCDTDLTWVDCLCQNSFGSGKFHVSWMIND